LISFIYSFQDGRTTNSMTRRMRKIRKLSGRDTKSYDQSGFRLRRRVNLFIQVHILLQYLARVDVHQRKKVQLVLKSCYIINQCETTVHDKSLADLIEMYVREAVGENQWQMAEKLRYSNKTMLLHSKNAFVQRINLMTSIVQV